MFFLAKALQANGILFVGVGLYLGISDGGSAGMWRELEFATVGVVLFYLGRLLERRAT